MVSIVCLAYNHSEYIRDALDGFLNQKTNFRFEVIVHDDASTDGTDKIIREYEIKYPNMIKPIYEEYNQYSKGNELYKTFINPQIRGKYIALCEGDDYWCDNNKLQKQVDFLEAHEEYTCCGHRHLMINCITGESRVCNDRNDDYQVDLDSIMNWTGKQFHTSSYVFRKEYFIIPDDIKMNSVGNYPQLVWLALHGLLYQFADVMSVYRFMANGSWSRNITAKDMLKKRKGLIEESINMLENAKKYASASSVDIIEQALNKYRMEDSCLSGNFKGLFQYRKEFMNQPIRKRIFLLASSISPAFVYKMMEVIKRGK